MHDGRITPSVVAAYARALELRERLDRGEVDRPEAHEAERIVDRALSIRLWQTSVFDVNLVRDHPDDPDWQRSAALRRQLDAALKEARRQRAQISEPSAPA